MSIGTGTARMPRSIWFHAFSIVALIVVVCATILVLLVMNQRSLLESARVASDYHLASSLHAAELADELSTVERQVTDFVHQPGSSEESWLSAVRRSIHVIDKEVDHLTTLQEQFEDPLYAAPLDRVLDQRNRYVQVVAAHTASAPPSPMTVARRIDNFKLRLHQFRHLHTNAYHARETSEEQTVGWRRFLFASLAVVMAGSCLIAVAAVKMSGAIRDRLNAEASLRASDQRFRQIAENIREVFWIMSADGENVIYVSPAYEHIWGRAIEDLYANPRCWFDSIHPDDRERVGAAFFESDASNFNQEFRVVRPDGSTRWIHARGFPVRNAEGEIYRIAGIAEDLTERVHAESERRTLASAVESSSDFIGIASLDGKPLYMNRGGREMTGLNDQELPAEGAIFEFLPEEDHDFHRKVVLPTVLAKGSWRGERALRHVETGARIPVELLVFQIPDTVTGEPAALVSIARDIAEQRRANQLLRQQAQVIEKTHDSVISTDLDGLVTSWNPGSEQLFGYTADEMMGRYIGQVYPQEEHAHLRDEIIAPLQAKGQHDVETLVQRKSGETFYIRLVLGMATDDDGNPNGMIGYSTDITQRKQIEAALRESEASLRNAQRIGRMGSWEWDILADALHWSDEIYRIFGLTPQEFGVSYEAFLASVHHDDRAFVQERVKAAVDGEADYSIDHRIVLPGGEVRFVHEEAEVTRNTAGVAIRMVGTVMDITARKKAEEAQRELERQLVQSQKMEALGRLAGGVAHDFNNLLTVILGSTELLLSALDETGELPAHESRTGLEQTQAAGNRASALTRQLLAFSRSDITTHAMCVDVREVVSNMQDMLRRLIGEQYVLRQILGDQPACVLADRSQIEQILLNLVVNAVDAMQDTGRVTVEVFVAPSADDDGDRAEEGNVAEEVILRVCDTGTGISPKIVDRIFEPFFTTKLIGEGTGLGLSTVYGAAENLGGRVEVSTEEGTGSTFTVRLPAGKAPLCIEEQSYSPTEAPTPATGTLLVCEDEPQVRDVICKSLRAAGYEVVEASSGRHAMRMLAEDDHQVELLITDVVMPGISGPELVAQLRQRMPELPVLYVSGYASELRDRDDVDGPAIDLLHKPFGPQVLLTRVRALLASASRPVS